MPFLKTDDRWPGFLRITPYIFLGIVINSIMIFGLSFVHGKGLYQKPKDSYRDYHDPSPVMEALFTTASSFFNAFFAAIAMVLHHRNQACPSRFLLMSFVFLLSWVVQFTYWTSCDIGNEVAATSSWTRVRFCVIWSPLAEFGHVDGGVLMTRFVVGALCMSSWGVLVSCSGATVVCERLRRDFERWTDGLEDVREDIREDEIIQGEERQSFEESVTVINGLYDVQLAKEDVVSSVGTFEDGDERSSSTWDHTV